MRDDPRPVDEPDVVGLIPAAGQASRLGPLPVSKELLPVAVSSGPGEPAATLGSHGILEGLAAAGIRRAFFVIRRSKVDVPRYLGGRYRSSGGAAVDLAYLPLRDSASVPETLDRAYPFVRGGWVAMGFPDVFYRPRDAFRPLLERRRETGADLLLGLFPTDRPSRTDMVELASDGRVRAIQVRPRETSLTYNWLLALWGPAFTELLHSSRERGAPEAPREPTGELQLGEIFVRALAEGLDVRGVPFPRGSFQDIGTPEDLAAAWAAPEDL